MAMVDSFLVLIEKVKKNLVCEEIFSLHWSITLGFYASSRGRLCKKHPRPTNILSQIYSRLIGPLMKMA